MAGSRKREYAYRREATPRGIERMERGELAPFDLEMYANLNTGVLEEYMDARNRRLGFAPSLWSWRRVGLGVAIGSLFALVTLYVGLKVGLLVYGAWYVTYLVGLGQRWSPGPITLATGAANGAAFIVTGFVYVFPALFLLSDLNAGQYTPLVPADALPSVAVAVVATVLAGFLGVTAFTVLRRLWLVEDPLPYPSFESFLKLLDMAHDVTAGAAERARHGIRLVVAFTGVGALFAFLRDVPVFPAVAGGGRSVLDRLLGGRAWWNGEALTLPPALAQYTSVGFALSPLLVATGWFLRSRAALAVAAGSAFVWFVAIPLAVWANLPVFLPAAGGDVGLRSLADAGRPSALLAFTGPIRALAAGALFGAGLTALLRMAPTIGSVTRDLGGLVSRARAGRRDAYVEGRGWYEWPPAHLLVLVAVAAVALPVAFVASGYAVGASLVFAILLVAATFVLGAVAVKVLGETSIEPVSGTSFIVFLLLVAAFQLLGLSLAVTLALGLLGTSVYASAISMTGDILLDFKNGLYVGTTPAAQVKAQLAGILPGAVIGVMGATVLATALARGHVDLAAPQANAFATLVQVMVGGTVSYTLLLVGLALGVLVEALTGRGTAFGIGMFLPVALVAPLVLGGFLRDAWEDRWLPRRIAERGWNEETRTIRILDSFMVATGLIVGEALLGTALAVALGAGLVGAS